MNRAFFELDDVDLDSFRKVCQQHTDADAYPFATDVIHNIVIYDGRRLRMALDRGSAEDTEGDIKAEFARCLRDGPGIFVIREAYEDLNVIDETTRIFRQIVEREKLSGGGRGDHFGNNERIWNSFQKACVADPGLFMDYYGNPVLRPVCEAWLGPNYQITAQVNNVKPGGEAQLAHRDYHLGFQNLETIIRFPSHAQMMSQFITLQGAIAHVDMPTEKGPTLFLPFSHHYPPGYQAYQRPDFANYFKDQHVQLPMAKGDMVLFSPAVFHAGGRNTTSSDRIANLIQVSSVFGRTMETVNHLAMIVAVYPALQARKAAGVSQRFMDDIIATVADGYSFPTNLDSDPPVDGNAPKTQQQMIRLALEAGWSLDLLLEKLSSYQTRRQS